MLQHIDAGVVLAVKNIETAAAFYRDVLGLPEASRMGRDMITFKSGNTLVSIYVSEFAGSNKATAVAWDVGDKMDEIVASLKERGVQFEHYDMPGSRVEGDVHVNGPMKTAWFKDPAGNLLNLVSRG